MGRPRLDRGVQLKNFVSSLREQFGDGPYTRDNLATVGDTNLLGFTLFTSKKQGYGNITRVSRGQYMVPTEWNTNPPWNVSNENTVAEAAASAD